MRQIRIGTRKSPLARWQASHVGALLQAKHPDIEVEMVAMTTTGDRFLGRPLATVGGKGLFLKELEEGLLSGHIDVAVHSMKDVPVDLPVELHVGAICERANPLDVLVSNHYGRLSDLPACATLGTTSLRRQCQLRHAYPKLRISDLRGNVGTRLQKLDRKEFDGIILAAAGLERLGMAERIRAVIDPDVCVPAVGQGAMGIECRRDDTKVNNLIKPLDHEPTRIRVCAERATNAGLGGGCHVPIGVYAELQHDHITLLGMVGRVDGSKIIRRTIQGQRQNAEALGVTLAEQLLSSGADEILRDVFAQG